MVPVVTNVSANFPSPVPATTNFQLAFRFDRTMDTNFTPQITLTNSTAGASQPVVSPGGHWSSVALNNDTFAPPPVTLTQGMDGTIAVFISGARDSLGASIGLTNVDSFLLDATPPVLSNVGANPSVLTAFITWNSDKPTSSLVEYGVSLAYGSSSGLFSQLVTAHGVTLYSLGPQTAYHYRVHSRDLAGNETVSGDYTFTTFSAPDLLVTNVVVSGSLVSGGNVQIVWADTNSGGGSTFTYWYDQVLVTNVTTAQTLFNSTLFYDPGASGNIAPGGSQNRQISFKLPDGPSGAGNLQAIITVNAYQNQYEANGSPNPYANNSAALPFNSSLAAYPDLQITGLAITNSQLQSGNTVGLIWNDANTGNGPVTTSFSDQITVVNQTTAQTLVNTVLADNAAGVPIAPGQATSRQFSFTLPDGAAGVGTLQVTVTADTYDNVFEYNTNGTAKSNNSASITVASSLSSYPDLVVTNVIVPASASAGQIIQVTWTDSNAGNGPATNIWTDQIFLADDLTLASEQLLGSLTFTNGLPVGQSVTNTQSVMLPIFGAGNKWLVVKADAGNAIFELNKSNNTGVATQPINLSPTLSLSISPSTFVQNAPNPAAVATVTRSGDTSSNLLVALSTTDPSSATAPASVTIPSGQSAATFQINAVASGLVRGTRLVTVTASASGYPAATNLVTILDNNGPTLSVSISLSSVGESYSAPISCTITRNTSTNVPLAVTLLSGDLSKLTVPNSITIPAGSLSAAFSAYVVSNAFPTSDKVVSVLPSASGYTGVPGIITVTDDDLPPIAIILADSFVTENTANPASQGTVSCKFSSPVQLTIVLQGDSSLLSLPPTVSIPAGQTSASFPVNVVNDHVVHGPTVVSVRAFIADALVGAPIVATGVTNSITVIDDNGPALTMALASGSISDNGSTLGTIRCNFAPLTNLVVTLASTDTGTATVPSSITIPAGQTSATFTVSGVNPGVPTGPRRATITASAPSFATGVADINVTDVNLPDLRVTGITLPIGAFASAITNFSYSVENDGVWAATNAWTDYIYYSASPSGASPHYLGQVQMTNSIAVGQTYTNTLTFFLPPNPGQYYVIVNVNPNQSLAELSYQNNNLVSSSYINVQADYHATVSADISSAPSGTPVPMHGYAFSAQNPAQRMPFVPITIRILVQGTRRVFTVMTDANGNFSYVFQPLSNEAGNYQLCADHPAVATDTVQSGFALYGMTFADGGLTRALYPGAAISGQVLVQNLGDLPLSGITAVAEGSSGNLGVQVAMSNSIPASGAVPLTYTLTAGNVSSPVLVRARIHVFSSQGAVAYYPITVTVAPPTASLIANPNSLAASMLRGQQTFVNFDIVNVGGAASGPIQMVLPQTPWLAAASGTNLASLAPGETNRVTLSLTPAADLALEPYSGGIGFAADNASLTVPFQFRAISDAIGGVQVTVQDDYTFYASGAPLVTNATVTLTDPYANSVVATGFTGPAGIVLLTNISEGSYQLAVTADRHNSFQMPVMVQAGQTNQLTAFIARQTVTYQWTVVPTQIQDNYQIVLESVFETEVPIPVVTVDNPLLVPLVVEGEDTEMDIQVSNHGLIAAQQVQLVVPLDNPDYEFQPLATNIDMVPAMSSVTVPVIIRIRSNSPALLALKPGQHAKDGGTTITGCPSLPKMTLKWGYICGNDFNWHAVDTEVVPVPVTTSCADAIKDRLKDIIQDLIKAGKNWKDVLNWQDQICGLTDVLEACGADHCITSILRLTCGLLSSGTISGAISNFGNTLSGALGMANCFCPSIPVFDPPPEDPVIPPPICSYCGGGGGPGGGGGGGGGITGWTWPGIWSGCTPGDTFGNPTPNMARTILLGKASATKNPISPKDQPTTSPGAVCAQVRIRIEQQAVVARAAFLGTLSIDNGDPNLALTNVQVSLDIRDLNQNPANDLFGIKGPVLSQLTATDGTGSLAPATSGSAQFTFVPTHNAAPQVAVQYKIGGTLQYDQNGSLVQVPLLPQQITVFPDPVLHLLYFQQRDVYGDDPFTPEIEPSEPFDLGLMVKNSGYGKAFNFTIASGQPKIVDNEKGLLINFTLIGTEVGSNGITPSLTANLGEIDPGQDAVAVWKMLSTLQGHFVEYDATFQQMDNFGNPQTSLIDSIEIHQLIHTVLANRPGDDAIPDFLVNDIPNPDSLPDTLYLSDGTTAPVNVVTNGAFDGPVSAGHMQVQLSTIVSNGWNYLQLPDPGPGYILQAAVRSDGKILTMTNDAWTTDRTFPSAITGAIREHLVHLFDYAGTGSYTLFYHSTNTTPPAILALGPVLPFNQTSAVSAVPIVFSELVDTNTFRATNVSLTVGGGFNLIPSSANLTLSLLSNTTYSINGLALFSASDGNYQLTVIGSGILDFWGNNAGNVSAAAQWAKGNAAVVVQSISPASPNPRNTPVTSIVVTFSKPITPGSFNYQALYLSRDAGPNLITSNVTVTAQTSSSFTVGLLGPLTGAQGNYNFSVSAASVQDTGGAQGYGSQSVTWSTITTGPTISALEQITSNPRNIVVRTLNVSFSEPIVPGSFDYKAITLTRDGGPNLITSDVTVAQIDPVTFQVGNISWVQGYAGTYSFVVDASSIQDLAGNSGTGSTNESWHIILGSPAPPSQLYITPDLGISASDGLTSTNAVTVWGSLGASNLTVRITDDTTGADLGTANISGTNFSQSLNFSVLGQHHLRLTAIDIAGNESQSAFFDLFLDIVPPAATIQQIASPRYAAVDSISVTFSKPINISTLSSNNFVVTVNGSNAVVPSLTFVSSNSFLLGNLTSYTFPLGTYQVALNLAGVQDLAGNQTTNVVTMSWVRGTTNVAPFLAPIPNMTVPPGTPVSFTALASDANGDQLTWSLAPGSPPGAVMRSTNGLFRWTPPRSFAESSNYFTLFVTDNGYPTMSATQSFAVLVGDYLALSLGSTNLLAGQSVALPVLLDSSSGVTNLVFAIQSPDHLLNSWAVSPLAPQIAYATLQDQQTNLLVTLGTAPGQPLLGNHPVSQLSFTAATNQGSSFINLPTVTVAGTKPNGAFYTNIFPQAGSVVVVQDQPLLLGSITNRVNRTLTIYGKPGATYQVQYKTNLSGAPWLPLYSFTQTNGVVILGLDATNPAAFYRLLQQ
ncbi:MAG: hypothetical protein C5B50_22285 [Verrucomicrobia bacterium]|nr:MAG: hypothetical protein C5B50_22285 [Verrucomicrobiota bacterium]